MAFGAVYLQSHTPLIMAVKQNNPEMLMLLLQHGCDPNKPNKEVFVS